MSVGAALSTKVRFPQGAAALYRTCELQLCSIATPRLPARGPQLACTHMVQKQLGYPGR